MTKDKIISFLKKSYEKCLEILKDISIKIQSFHSYEWFKRNFNSEQHTKQLRFLSQASVLEEASLPYRFKFIIFAVTGASFLMIIWASIAQIKEVAKTVGEIIPTSPIQVIQHLEGGNVAEILVEEGSIVKKDQPLIRISGHSVRAELERAQAKETALQLQSERYRSFARYAPADFDKIKNNMNNLADDQRQILQSMIENREKQKEIIAEQINQRHKNLDITKAKIETLKKNIPLVQESYNKKKQLFDKHFLDRNTMIEVEKDLNNLKGELEKANSEMEQDKQSITEFETRLKSLETSLRDQAYEKLSALESEIAENKEIVDKLKGQVNRLDIKSPIDGIVKGLEITTIGGVITPGQKLMEIVPTDDDLMAEIKISPNDIANVEAGQECLVKVSTYDFSKYGGIEGVITTISPTTFLSKEGIPFYKGRLKLDKNYVGNDPKNIVRPGNLVNVNIITGEKSIMAYLLKPIRNALSISFSER